jgi:protoporphyrinogen/coproporphyrinogen III oxidase
VARYERVMPHYHVGHLDRAAAIEAAVLAHPWLSLAGNSLRGVGLPDAIHAGEVAAERAMGTPLVPQGGSST